MAAKILVPWLLLLLVVVAWPQGSAGQHWSYGLSPGGKRGLDSFADTLGNGVEGFPQVEPPCSVLACPEESLFAKMYRMKGPFGIMTNRENGHRSYKK